MARYAGKVICGHRGAPDPGRLGERLRHLRRVSPAALGEVRFPAPSPADKLHDLLQHGAGVHVDVLGATDDQLDAGDGAGDDRDDARAGHEGDGQGHGVLAFPGVMDHQLRSPDLLGRGQ